MYKILLTLFIISILTISLYAKTKHIEIDTYILSCDICENSIEKENMFIEDDFIRLNFGNYNLWGDFRGEKRYDFCSKKCLLEFIKKEYKLVEVK